MSSSFTREPGAGLADDELPGYRRMLDAYHRARATELCAILATLPLSPDSQVLDVACGDGWYSARLAERAGAVVGIDRSPAYLDLARRRTQTLPHAERISFQCADAAALPFAAGAFGLVWCAQSLYSLPDPIAALRELVRVTRPGGSIAILENDALHQVLLPWPIELELAVRQAQFRALAAEQTGRGLDKFYIARNLCGLFRQCGVESCEIRTFPVERRAPLDADEELFLQLYFGDLRERAWPYLDTAARTAFDMLFDPYAETYLLRRPDFHLTYLESLAIGHVCDTVTRSQVAGRRSQVAGRRSQVAGRKLTHHVLRFAFCILHSAVTPSPHHPITLSFCILHFAFCIVSRSRRRSGSRA